MSPREYRVALTVFVGAVFAGSALVLAGAGLPASFDLVFAAWFLSCLAGEMLWIRTPSRSGTISMALALDLAALMALPPERALPIVAVSALVASLYPHRRPLHRALFNAGQSTLAAAAALVAMGFFTPGENEIRVLSQETNWAALYAGGLAFFAVNSGLVAVAIALHTRRGIWASWRDNFGYTFELATTGAQISLAGFILVGWLQVGPMAVMAVLPVLGVLWWSSARESDLKARAGSPPAPPAEDEDEFRRAG